MLQVAVHRTAKVENIGTLHGSTHMYLKQSRVYDCANGTEYRYTKMQWQTLPAFSSNV